MCGMYLVHTKYVPRMNQNVLSKYQVAFLCLHAIHKLADCLFHGGCILSVKNFFILWAGISIITPVNQWASGTSMFASHCTPKNPVKPGSVVKAHMY